MDVFTSDLPIPVFLSKEAASAVGGLTVELKNGCSPLFNRAKIEK